MLEKLTAAAERQAAGVIKRQIGRLAQISTPRGITAAATGGGIVLTGKGLRRRMLSDPSLRNFGR